MNVYCGIESRSLKNTDIGVVAEGHSLLAESGAYDVTLPWQVTPKCD